MAERKAKTPLQSEAIDREINALDIRGYSHVEIARRLEITPSAVSQRLKKINARALADRADHIAKELRTLDDAMREAVDAWKRSQADATVTVVEKRKGGDRILKRTASTVGDAAFLALIPRISESRRKLLGLDAATKAVQATLTAEQLAAMSDEELEALYAKLNG